MIQPKGVRLSIQGMQKRRCFHYKAWDKDPDRIPRYRWTAFPEMPCNFDIECETQKIGSVCVTKSIWSEIPLELSADSSRDGLCAIPSFVPLCHKNRLLSIVKPKETFAKYPGLRTGKHCYGIVAAPQHKLPGG